MATFAPSLANRIAVARPIPLPAPVTKATLPASLGIVFSFSTANSKTARSGSHELPQSPRPQVLEHDTALAQCRDLVGGIAATGEDLIAMLAKSRSRCWRRPRRLSEFKRPLHRAITSYLRMIEGRDEILGEHLGMVEHV